MTFGSHRVSEISSRKYYDRDSEIHENDIALRIFVHEIIKKS